jgi:hypothetical protein
MTSFSQEVRPRVLGKYKPSPDISREAQINEEAEFNRS